MKFVSPVSGVVTSVERGARRKVLNIVVEAAAEQDYEEFGKKDVSKLDGEAVKAALLEAGMFAFMKQRPYDVIADPTVAPRAIFISAFDSQLTVIPEGDDIHEMLGWIMPRFNQFSVNRSYFSWLMGNKKEYVLDARIKGGERHMIMSGEYDKVFPCLLYTSPSPRDS